jgi:hypothetical protein
MMMTKVNLKLELAILSLLTTFQEKPILKLYHFEGFAEENKGAIKRFKKVILSVNQLL